MTTVSQIEDEVKDLKSTASDMREYVSQLCEQKVITPEVEGKLHESIDEIKGSCDSLESLARDVENEIDDLEESNQGYKNQIEEEGESPELTSIDHTTIEYHCTNFQDQQIMEALGKLLHVQSKLTPLQVLNRLEEMAKAEPAKQVMKRAA